jgi:hypothetical protein
MASPSNQATLSAFPSLTSEEFACACRAFLDRVHDLAGDPVHVDWSSVRLVQKVRISFYERSIPWTETARLDFLMSFSSFASSTF